MKIFGDGNFFQCRRFVARNYANECCIVPDWDAALGSTGQIAEHLQIGRYVFSRKDLSFF